MSGLRIGTKNSVVTNSYNMVPTLTVDFVVLDYELQEKLLQTWQFGYNNQGRVVELLTELANSLAELLDEA